MNALPIFWMFANVFLAVGFVVCGRRLAGAVSGWMSFVFRSAGVALLVSVVVHGVERWWGEPFYRMLDSPIGLIGQGVRMVSGVLSFMVCIALLQLPRYLRDFEERIAMFEESR